MEVVVRGFAWAGGGRGVAFVEVSGDGGKTWTVADIAEPDCALDGAKWAWRLWSAVVPLPLLSAGEPHKAQLICRATDSAHNVQPLDPAQIWNFRGLGNNSVHAVEVKRV